MTVKLKRRLFKEAYTVALICPLEVEMSAVRYMLDDEHAPLPLDEHDPNQYILGELSGHNVVIASLPEGSQGTNSAAAVAVHLARSFPTVNLRLLVGIGGGVPIQEVDIRLGDVVISTPSGTSGGVVEYDLGKQNPDSFERKGFLCPPPPEWRSIITMMRSEHRTRPNKIKTYISDLATRFPLLDGYQWPGAGSDVLYSAEYEHATKDRTCLACDKSKIIDRCKRRMPDQPHIFYGLIASGNRVLKHAKERDRISRDAGGAICFEMEAAGLMNHFPCIVIRGICDYADSHKNDAWHAYAAAAAAACCKEMLSFTEPTLNPVVSTTIQVKMALSKTDQALEVLYHATVLQCVEESAPVLINETLGLRRILGAIELSLTHQKVPPITMVRSLVAIENMCSDASIVLSEIRALIDILLHKNIASSAELVTELSPTDPQRSQSEICSLSKRLKKCNKSFSEMLATNINIQFPVSYYESEHELRIYPEVQTISSIERPARLEIMDNRVSDLDSNVSDVPDSQDPKSGPPRVDSISVEECERFCPCECHIHSQLRAPKWVKGLFGSFTWQANGSILLNRRPCNYRLCRKSRETYLQISYFAPSWAFQGALSLRAARLSLRGSNASISISLPRVIPRNEVIWSAIQVGKLVEIREMVAEKRMITPNDVVDFGTSLLHYAAIFGHVEIAAFLIDQGANRFFQDPTGVSAIQPGLDQALTGQVKDEQHARIFANSEILDEQEFTIFHQIVLGFCYTELEKQFKFSYRDIDLPDANGRTPLLWAAWRGDVPKVKVLLKLGADPNKKDLEGFSPLAKAAQSGHLDCVRALVENGASVTATTYWGLEPIHLSCQNVMNGPKVVEYLLAHGASATAPTPGRGTPLHFACNRGATTTVRLLLKQGVDIDVRNMSGDSPVMAAAQGGCDDITCLLIDMGAKLDFQSNDGLNIVHFVVFSGGVRTFKALTKAINDGQLPAVYLKAQHEGHDIRHCFESCRRLRASGDTGITADQRDMFRRLLNAVDKIQ